LYPNLKVAAGIIGFNDREGLRRTLQSVYNGVDMIFYIDGKFPTYPYPSDLSDDGSRQLVRDYYSEKTLLVDCARSEFEKRQKYLDLCRHFDIDILLIIDTDEWVVPEFSDWSLFRQECYQRFVLEDKEEHNIYNIKMFNRLSVAGGHILDLWVSYPRVWYKPADMHYARGRHYEFVSNKDGVLQTGSEGNDSIYSIRLKHDHELRTTKHQESREIYQKWLIDYEANLAIQEAGLGDKKAQEERLRASMSC